MMNSNLETCGAREPAPKGLNSKAQAGGLGARPAGVDVRALKGRHDLWSRRWVAPLQGYCNARRARPQGRCPWLSSHTPFGAENLSFEKERSRAIDGSFRGLT